MPRSIPCPTCGQAFLPSGLKFHQKTCRTRQENTIVACPHCSMELPRMSLDGHIAMCKSARRATANSRNAGAFATSSADWSASAGGPCNLTQFSDESRADGHARCQHCGRFFTNMRVHDHRAICGKLRQARPSSIGGVRTQLPGRIYNSAAARTTFKGSFDRQRCKLFIPREAAEKKGLMVRCAGVPRKIGSRAAASIRPWTVLNVERGASTVEVKEAYRKLALQWHPDKHPEATKVEAEARFKAIAEAFSVMTKPRKAPRDVKRLALVDPASWRSKHQHLMSSARAGRGGGGGGGGGGGARSSRAELTRGTDDGRIQCPHCCRRFGQVQSERHIAKCAGIVNKPKRPPQAGPPSPKSRQPLPCRQPLPRSDDVQKFAPGVTVRVDGLSGASALNGVIGVLVDYDSMAERWHVDLKQHGIKAVRRENLHWPSQPVGAGRSSPPQHSGGVDMLVPGASVRLEGLVGAAQLNGLVGVLRDFDQQASRWHVDLPSGETKSVRPDNLHLARSMSPTPSSLSPPKRPPQAPPVGTTARMARGTHSSSGGQLRTGPSKLPAMRSTIGGSSQVKPQWG